MPVPGEPPIDQEEEFPLDVPAERQPRPRPTPAPAPTVPTLRPMAAFQPAAKRLAQTGVDPRLLAAGGTFLIGVGLALFGITLPRRV